MKNNQLYNLTTLVLWLLACALTPVLGHIWSESWVSGFGKKYVYAELLNMLMIWGIFIIPFLIAILNYWPFRRISEKPFFGKWLAMGLLTLILANIASGYSNAFVSNSFRHFIYDAHWGPAFSSLDYVFTTHWLLLIAGALICAAAYALIAKIILEGYTGFKWWFFVLSAFLATLLCLLLAQSLDFLGLHTWYDSYNKWSLSSKSWSSRWLTLLEQGLCGAFWGWLSYTALCRLTKSQFQSGKETSNRKSILVSGLLVIATLAATHAVQHPQILKRLSIGTELMFSSAPKQDVSTGKNILMFVSVAQVSPPVLPQYPVVDFAPDSQSFVMLDSQRMLQRIEASTGKSLGKIAEPIGTYERHERAWSASGRFFVLRTSAESVTVGRGYTKHRSKIRLYDGINYKLLGEYTHRVDECFEASDPSIAFEGDVALWLTCAHEYTQQNSENIMAIKLALPNLTVQEIVRYGEYAPQHAVGGIASDAGHVYAWQDNLLTDNKHIYLHDLTAKTKPLLLPDLTQKYLAGSLTQQFESIEKGVMHIPFCGNDDQVSDPQVKEVGKKKVHGFCRTLGIDIKNGQIIFKKDKVTPSSKVIVNEVASKQYPLLFKTTYTDTSRQGEIVATNLDGREKLQSIKTTSQNSLKLSPNSRWLVTYALYDNKIRIYRVNH